MEYQVALAPDLGISPEGFVAAWNESAQRPAGAEARLGQADATQYDPLALTIIIAVGSAAGGNLLSDSIKSVIAHLRGKGAGSGGEADGRSVTVIEVPQADATRVLVVTAEKR